MKYLRQRNILIVVIVLLLHSPLYAGDYYVDQSVIASGDGLSWATAKITINEAMKLASPGDAVHVAEGHYEETVTVNNSVTMLGGYPAGGGTRDFKQYASIIDAGFPRPTQPVVTMGSETTIDGFTIVHGNGFPSMIFSTYGGGIYCYDVPVVIRNNVISKNVINSIEGAYGAGIYIYGGTGDIYNNIITGNEANGMGGISAICAWDSTVNIYNNYIQNNTSSLTYSEGSIEFRDTAGSIYNNSITGNTAGSQGGIFLINSSPAIYNNIIYLNDGYGIMENDPDSDPQCLFNNISENTLGLYYDEGTTVYSSAISLNTSVPEAENNIDCDPEFIVYDDYHLIPTSCCVDAGTNTGAPPDDLDEEPRPAGVKVDIGCDEVIPPEIPAASHMVYFSLLVLFSGVLLKTKQPSYRSFSQNNFSL